MPAAVVEASAKPRPVLAVICLHSHMGHVSLQCSWQIFSVRAKTGSHTTLAIFFFFFSLQEHISQRDKSCQIEVANLEGTVKTKSIALNKIIALEEKVGRCICVRVVWV